MLTACAITNEGHLSYWTLRTHNVVRLPGIEGFGFPFQNTA